MKTEQETEYYRLLGTRLKRYRQAAGLTQDSVATYLGKTRSNVSNMESGRLGMYPFTMMLLSNLYGVPPTELMPSLAELQGDQDPEPLPPLVIVKLRTRHPEHYRLVNLDDRTQWKVGEDREWERVT